MRNFSQLYEMAAKRKGGTEALEKLLDTSKRPVDLASIPDDRWLSKMAQCIFNAGFNWKVVEAKWPGFEEAFEGFCPARVAMFSDDDLARLVSDGCIVRHGGKIRSVLENAAFVCDVAKEYGSFGAYVGQWPPSDTVGLLEMLKKRGSRLGGNTGQYFLRFMGYDNFLLSADVIKALIREGVVEKSPASKSALQKVQQAFNGWQHQSGRRYKDISRVLAMSVD